MKNRLLRNSARTILILAACNAYGGATDLATVPLVTSSTSSVLPNLLFVLDDSGSMGWNYLPDWANDTDPFSSTSYTSIAAVNRNAGFNGVAYNPAVTYSPPVYYNADGTLNTTTYPSQTSANTSTWTAVKNDGYGVQSTSTSNITGSAYYYTFLSGEYCDSPSLRTCTTASVASTSYPYAATLRWCSSTAMTTCQASWISGSYTKPRYPKQATATITVSGSTSTTVSSIKVNSQEILSATTTASTDPNTVAIDIVAKINACLPASTGNCQVAGYSAYNSSTGVVTINAPVTAGNITYTPVITKSGMTVTAVAFSGYSVPGVNFRRDIVSTTDSYPYPGSTTKASSRTDCAGTTCTYAEEMTNFANWWAYYRTRMQMMKSSASNAFSSIGTNYRVGYISIDNTTGSDFLNIAQFDNTQKKAWYDKLFAADPGSNTPLRAALSKAGRLYAGKLNGTTLNGSTVTDPMQYSCQQNFTILSTDGYWNDAAGYKVDGSTSVGNQDGTEPRPFSDGATVTYNQSTSQLQYSQTRLTETTTQIQSRTLQTQTSRLQQRTGSLQWTTNQQQTTAALKWQTKNQVTKAALKRATLAGTYTRWRGTLQVGNSAGGPWSNASGSTTYTCLTSGSASGNNKYCQVTPTSTTGRSSCSVTVDNTSTVAYTNLGTATTDSSGRVISACIPEWGTPSNVGANGTCAGDGTTVQCSIGTTTTTYAPYPGTCSVTYNGDSASSTADSSGNVTTSCPTSGTWSTAANVGSNNTCAGNGTTIQCSTGTGSSAYLTTYPPNCTATYNGTSSSSTADASGNIVTACPVSGSFNTTWTNVSGGGSCTAGANVNCQYNWGSWSNASSCTVNQSSGGGAWTITSGTDCQYAAWTNAACSPDVAQSAGSPYSVGTACRTLYNGSTVDNGYVGAASCTPSGPTGGQTVLCNPSLTTGPTAVGSCSTCSIPSGSSSCTTAASSANSYTQTTCANSYVTPAVGAASCTADPATAGNGWVSTNCATVTTGPTSTSTCTAAAASASNNYTTTTCSVGSSTGGTSNTLSDVAEYYYATDLRTAALGNCTGAAVAPAITGNDVCSNDVPTSGQDGASWQHMTTFTLGLGANGYMQFSPSYATATSGDFYSVRNGVSSDPTNGVCSWQSSGSTCNWPTPASDSQANIDDLWHAAVNGRGTYFSATSPSTLSAGLSSALAGVSARLGAAAAATTSNPNVTTGDNFIFSSTFTTQDWAGQLYRQQIDLTTGIVPDFDVNSTSTYDWAAQAQLDANATRTIYTYDSAVAAAASKLKLFTWANLTSAEQDYFNTTNISSLSQFCAAGVTCLSAASQTAAAGSNLLSFITGDRSNEGVSTDITKYYRQRAHVLGDIVNAEAVYVKTPLFTYADSGYTDFITAKATRVGMVYAASNDGMLHAFNATTGAEVWAYVPSMVLPNLYKLADKNYSAQHQYFVDGTPVVGDICPNAPGSTCTSSQWKTILVGGLNRGGRGYYAMDITDPASPKVLWEFTDTNMGYTYGNPVITKYCSTWTTDATTHVTSCTAKTWVVLVTSGYNNTLPGDGVGRLYVLNANTGALIRSISTGVGDTTTPSGLARINAWVDNGMSDNFSLRVYGGDLLGNLWRFDINDNVGASGYEAERLTTFYSNAAGTTLQPITSKPELGDVGGVAVVFVGTGRYLGSTDLSDTSLQSFYAVKDRLGSEALTPFANPRATGSGFVQQTQTSTTCPAGSPTSICTTGQSVRTSSSNTVNFASDNGWFIDLPDSGERSNTDASLALGTLGFTTNIPNVSACTAGGYSYRYFLDYRTGAAVSTSTTSVVAVKLGNALATRGVFVRLPNNTIVQLTRMSSGTTITSNVPIGAGAGNTRRVSWRQLVTGQ